MSVMKQIQEQNNQSAIFLAETYDLSFMNFIIRQTAYGPIKLCQRTCVSRTQKGNRVAIKLTDIKGICYLILDNNGIAMVLIADDEYPEKVAFIILNEMYQLFIQNYQQEEIEKIKSDTNLQFNQINNMIKTYQDPQEADKMMKLESTLKDVTYVLHKTMEDLIKRGETLDELVQKSKDISTTSYQFYKKARQTNQKCCSLY